MDFDEWFEENREDLEELLRLDQNKLLRRAWSAGYKEGMGDMGEFAKELWDIVK